MVSLTCPRCGREVEVSESLRGEAIRCARCGQVLAADAPSRDPKTEIGGAPMLPARPPEGDAATKDQSKDGDTQGPKPRELGFPFLSPPRSPNELGWLAHYQVLRLLGQGGMGIIFEAFDPELERSVALKVMKPELAQDSVAQQRFLREARVMASLKSDYVVTVHQVGVHNNVPFLAAEFLNGQSLDRWLQHHGRPGIAEILRLSIEVGRGLIAAHEHGLIHRDIKPANIFLETRGEQHRDSDGHGAVTPIASRRRPPVVRAKILDFGLVQVAGKVSQLTNPGLVMGTPAYMAPEQVEGKAVDARSDLFSLGCVMYEMATGAPPFTGENSMAVLMAVATKHPKPPRELNPNLPPPLAKLILQLLAKKPNDRLNSAEDVVAALEGIAGKLGIATDTPSSGSDRILAPLQVGPAPWRRRLGVGLALVFAGGVVGSLLVAYLIGFRPHQFVHAAPVVQGVTDTDVLLGMTGPFNGPARELGLEMKVGIDTYFNSVNERGGVAGRKLGLIDLDDGYDPDRALANITDLFQQRKVFGFIGNVGTAAATKTLPYLLQKQVLDFGPYSGANLLRRDPPERFIFNYRASYAEETAALVSYLVETRKVRPEEIAVFAQNDAYGDDGFRGAVKVLKQAGSGRNNVLRVGYDRNTLKVSEAVKTIQAHPEIHAVILVASYKPAAAFIEKIKDANPALILACISGGGSEALAESLVERGPQYAKGLIFTQVVPPVDSGATLVLNYRAALKKHHPSEQPNVTSLEGYIDAALLVEGLKRAGKDLTTDTLIDALESIRDFDLGTGTPITFSPSRHQASHKVWGTVLDHDGRFQELALDE